MFHVVMCKSLKIIFYQYAEFGGTRRITNSRHDGLLPQSRPNKVTYSTRTPVNNAAEQLRMPAGTNKLYVRELSDPPSCLLSRSSYLRYVRCKNGSI